MRFSLKHILLFLILLLTIGGLILTAFLAHSFYQLSVNRFFEEKKADLELIAHTITSPYWVHQETTFFSGVTEFFIREVAESPDVQFIRIVDERGAVLASSRLSERNTAISDFPKASSFIALRSGIFEGRPIEELSVSISDNRQLWMGISTEGVIQQILTASLLVGAFALILLATISWLTVLLVNRFLTRPLTKLTDSFLELGKGRYGVRLGESSLSEMGLVFSTFNDMAKQLEKIHERERLIAESKSQFIDIAAHQLRTPTSTFRWVFSTLIAGEAGKINDKQKELLIRARETNDNFIRLIDDLLNANRIEQGNIHYTFAPLQIEGIITEAVEELRPLAKARDVTISYGLPRRSFGKLNLDRHLMKIALLNLIENAVRYSTPGKTVEIKTEKLGANLLVSVRDQGVGIPEHEQERLFEKFFRASNATALFTEGTGLGLYLVRSIAEKHDGRVWFESKEGKGSTFFLELPMSKK